MCFKLTASVDLGDPGFKCILFPVKSLRLNTLPFIIHLCNTYSCLQSSFSDDFDIGVVSLAIWWYIDNMDD
jgi:hypothetical protein